MRVLRTWLAAGVGAAALAIAACGPAPLPIQRTTPEARIVQLVNAERAAHGLPPVVVNPVLERAANDYAEAMAEQDFFSHTGKDGSRHAERVEQSGYTGWTFTGENLAAGQTTPERVVEQWMKSPTHRANVLAPQARDIGIGHARNGNSTYRNYWTMETGARP